MRSYREAGLTGDEGFANLKGPAAAIDNRPYFLATLPRSGATAVELIFANQGGQELSVVECNPFDICYYFVNNRGAAPPEIRDVDLSQHTFDAVSHRLADLAVKHGPDMLVRSAAYALEPYLSDQPHKVREFLGNFQVILCAAEPNRTLWSHTDKLIEEGARLSLEESGFPSLCRLAETLQGQTRLLLFDEMLKDPVKAFERAGLDLNPLVTWQAGERARWALWNTGSWKITAAKSIRFEPGAAQRSETTELPEHPMYGQCKSAYDRLLALHQML